MEACGKGTTHRCSPLQGKHVWDSKVFFFALFLLKARHAVPIWLFPSYPPATRTPFIWVQCIFFNKDKESSTRIFLQPWQSRIYWTYCKRKAILKRLKYWGKVGESFLWRIQKNWCIWNTPKRHSLVCCSQNPLPLKWLSDQPFQPPFSHKSAFFFSLGPYSSYCPG